MLDNTDSFDMGLCYWAVIMCQTNIITVKEYFDLLDYINNNRPSKFSSIEAFKYRNRRFYWESGNIKPRIKWLQKHIKKNS